MVKNRKPLMVSNEARQKLKELSVQKKMFMGDVVDILVGVRTDDDVREEYAAEKRIRRRSWGVESEGVHST